MNKIESPKHDDLGTLRDVCRNSQMSGFPRLWMEQSTVLGAYADYTGKRGNVLGINPITLVNPDLPDFLRGYYKSTAADLAFIKRMRAASRHKTCAMCGSEGSVTLDHIFPQSTYPEFSFLSVNMVPACPCNSLRKDLTKGAMAGQRILHPYFDDCLSGRLLSATFKDPGEAPEVDIRILISQRHPEFAAVEFHVTELLRKTAIIEYLIDRWAKLWRMPDDIVPGLEPGAAGSRREVIKHVLKQRRRVDRETGSRNNWKSIFLTGLLDGTVVDWLVHHANSAAPRMVL